MTLDLTLDSTLLAKRIPDRVLPPPTTDLQKTGLSYERKVVKVLRSRGLDLEHNPWFSYTLKGFECICCPDVVIYELSKTRAIVVEVKVSATPAALDKLRGIYCPVVTSATGLQTLPLIITKTVSKFRHSGLVFKFDIQAALESESPVLLWPGKGSI